MTDEAKAITSLDQVISIKYDKAPDGTYFAQMVVTGLLNPHQAEACVAHMQMLFCGQEQRAYQ